MSNLITVEYEGITITYRESDNRWAFELRGRNRSAESLEKAKEAIDKPVDEKEKPFTRIPIYLASGRYGENAYVEGEVTSIAEGGYGSTKYVWVSKGKERSKKAVYYCFKRNAANTKLISEIKEIQDQIDGLAKQRSAKQEKLEQIEIT